MRDGELREGVLLLFDFGSCHLCRSALSGVISVVLWCVPGARACHVACSDSMVPWLLLQRDMMIWRGEEIRHQIRSPRGTNAQKEFVTKRRFRCYNETQWLGMYRQSESRAGNHRSNSGRGCGAPHHRSVSVCVVSRPHSDPPLRLSLIHI